MMSMLSMLFCTIVVLTLLLLLLLGVPYDQHSSFMRGACMAPAAIRAALVCGASNWSTERGLDLDPNNNSTNSNKNKNTRSSTTPNSDSNSSSHDLSSPSSAWFDSGDIHLPPDEKVQVTLRRIRNRAQRLLLHDSNRKLLALGGDHLISLPLVQAAASKFGKLNILHLDAHADLYDNFEGNRYSHASPNARMLEHEG